MRSNWLRWMGRVPGARARWRATGMDLVEKSANGVPFLRKMVVGSVPSSLPRKCIPATLPDLDVTARTRPKWREGSPPTLENFATVGQVWECVNVKIRVVMVIVVFENCHHLMVSYGLTGLRRSDIRRWWFLPKCWGESILHFRGVCAPIAHVVKFLLRQDFLDPSDCLCCCSARYSNVRHRVAVSRIVS
jgi:hypothetical protein